MRTRRGRLLVASTTLLSLVACSHPRSLYNSKAALPNGDVLVASERSPAGPVTGDLVTGGRYSLAGDRGRAVILNYFATWCAPCQIETPQLDAFAKTVDRSKVDVVAVDVKDISQDAAMSWLREKRVSLPVVWDSPARTALELGDVPLFVLPATVVIDASGRIAAVYFSRVTPDDLRRALTALG